MAYVGRETQKVHVKTYDVLDNGELNFKHHEDVGENQKGTLVLHSLME
ncbi:MAG: hypothetical protein P8Y18_01750 [Candidatus Bathyarchaeota archaeon]